ncbi:hypothetical protein A0H81_09239 [Grifola frondosa]|uniref:Arrestin C-terminal-like domain-containing protein n=1 Tax=Grifola frondosa TaxID=5627 RepID=A0A1C7M2I9_GRIFR|nr:hypothetical protein A0H81_09239 [Grifola frondosa]
MSYVLARPSTPNTRDSAHSDRIPCRQPFMRPCVPSTQIPLPFPLLHSLLTSPTCIQETRATGSTLPSTSSSTTTPCVSVVLASTSTPPSSAETSFSTLSEPTSIKEITLQFRGKATLPVSATESLSLSSSPLTLAAICFRSSCKLGFPPSSVYTSALGGASVQYKLRAHAARGGFGLTHRDFTAIHPISIMRGFGTEALEYQQTLEIENTWPEKLMYSIMIPHKAWAAGERVIAVVKFSPLVKGARVLSVTTTLNETVKLYARTGPQENTRIVSSTRHEIVDGKAVCMDEQHHPCRIPLLHHSAHTSRQSTSVPGSPGYLPNGFPHQGTSSGYFSPISRHDSPTHTPPELAPLTVTRSNSSASSGPSSRPSTVSSTSVSATQPPPPSVNTQRLSVPVEEGFSSAETDLEPSSDIITTLTIEVPINTTPSHSLEPIQVSHRIRWSILIGNLDGHTSELRCSLPIHVLDNRLYDEARAATLQTRRLLLGSQDIDGGSAVGTTARSVGRRHGPPHYPAHVRDRVANAFLPDSAPHVCPAGRIRKFLWHPLPAALETWAITGHNMSALPRDHLPQEPVPGAQPLEWVNTELLLSLGREAPEAIPPASMQRATPPHRTPPESSAASRPESHLPSRRNSRSNSRASSPERGSRDLGGMAVVAGPHLAGETFVHGHSTASRNVNGLFNIAMKPFTSLTSTFSLASRSGSHANLQARALAAHICVDVHRESQCGSSAASRADDEPGVAAHAFTQVRTTRWQAGVPRGRDHSFVKLAWTPEL